MGTKKGSKSYYAKGLINVKKSGNTILVDIKYDPRKELEIKQLISSFYTGTVVPERNNEALETGLTADKSTADKNKVNQIVIAEQKAKEDALAAELAEQKRKEEERKRAEAAISTPIPMVDIPVVPEYDSPKHPEVHHANLIKLTTAQKQEFVDSHNHWRADVGVAPLTWSNDLENFAGEWVIIKGEEGCDMQHRPITVMAKIFTGRAE